MKEYIIKVGDTPDIEGNYPLEEKPKELIRCKDCKHRTRRICNSIELWECNHIRYEIVKCGVTDDWFCADGERKEEQ